MAQCHCVRLHSYHAAHIPDLNRFADAELNQQVLCLT